VVGSAQPTVCVALGGNLGAPTLIVNSGIVNSGIRVEAPMDERPTADKMP